MSGSMMRIRDKEKRTRGSATTQVTQLIAGGGGEKASNDQTHIGKKMNATRRKREEKHRSICLYRGREEAALRGPTAEKNESKPACSSQYGDQSSKEQKRRRGKVGGE